MQSEMKQAYVGEIKYQTKMLNNLKVWLRNMIMLSSISLILILFGDEMYSFLSTVGIILMVLSVIACLTRPAGYRSVVVFWLSSPHSKLPYHCFLQ